MTSDLMQAIGRVALVSLFVWSGLGKLTAPAALTATLAAKGFPAPKLLTLLAGGAEFGLGVLIMIGWQTTIAALALALFISAATLISHRYWTMSGEAFRLNQIQAFKNVSLIGALLTLAAVGPGRIALGRNR